MLVAPESLGVAGDVEQVRTTLRSARGEARALVRVRYAGGLSVAALMTEAGLPVDVLLAPTLCRTTIGRQALLPPRFACPLAVSRRN